jgi:ubiquitin carboxyl-terminal hydrolase 9/13
MAGFFSKIKSAGSTTTAATTKDAVVKKKDEPAQEMTPLEKMLLNAGPLRPDGSDRFYGFENFGNTWYGLL